MTKKSYCIHVSGRVQGVGFRYFVRQKAEEFEICGFVKNQHNGSVYIEAEAGPLALENFLVRIERGNSYSIVKDIRKSEQPVQHYSQFEIRY